MRAVREEKVLERAGSSAAAQLHAALARTHLAVIGISESMISAVNVPIEVLNVAVGLAILKGRKRVR